MSHIHSDLSRILQCCCGEIAAVAFPPHYLSATAVDVADNIFAKKYEVKLISVGFVPFVSVGFVPFGNVYE